MLTRAESTVTDPPPLLSQQVLAYFLQAAGLEGSTQKVKRSTLKNARAGKPIPPSWKNLIEEYLALFNRKLTDTERNRLHSLLRDWDRRVSGLHTHGLPPEDLLPAILKVAGPELGFRMGSLAAMVVPGKVQDWICDPLSPALVGRMVEYMFKACRPECNSWDERYKLLKGMDRRTVEKWRKEDLVEVPHPSNLVVVAGAMGSESEGLALALLRLGRLLTCIRKDIAEVGGAEMAEQFANVVRIFAGDTCKVLSQPSEVAALAVWYADLLEGAHGEVPYKKLKMFLPSVSTPQGMAELIRLQAEDVRDSGQLGPLRWLLWSGVLDPHAPVVLLVHTRLGAPAPHVLLMADTVQRLQSDWNVMAMARMVKNQEPIGFSHSGSAPTSWTTPSRGLVEIAERVYRNLKQIGQSRDEIEQSDRDLHALAFGLTGEAGGIDVLMTELERYNHYQKVCFVPAELEPMLTEEQLLPHHMIQRARRLLKEGKSNEGARWAAAWGRSGSPGSPAEYLAYVESQVGIGHQVLDLLVATRTRWRALPREVFSAGAGEKIQLLIGKIKGQVQTTLEMYSIIQNRINEVLSSYLSSSNHPEALVLALPLAIRMDLLAKEWGEEHARSQPIVEKLEQLPQRSGPVWAMLALWFRCTEQDAREAEKQARHLGCGELLDREWKRIEDDLL